MALRRVTMAEVLADSVSRPNAFIQAPLNIGRAQNIVLANLIRQKIFPDADSYYAAAKYCTRRAFTASI